MRALLTFLFCLIVSSIALRYSDLNGQPFSVSFNHRSFLLNNEPVLLQSGSIHYPRSVPSMWPGILNKTAAAGLNMVDMYVFWNIHEKEQGNIQWEGRYDIVQFIQLAAKFDLFVHLRIGPYVCAEWDYGGIPYWVRELSNVEFRTYNNAWIGAMKNFIVAVLDRVQPLLAKNGGPIILAQVENEYGTWESLYSDAGKQYVQWAADTVLGLEPANAWVMCIQTDAPAQIVNTCNGFYCDDWLSTHFSSFPNMPGGWTENWGGWFQTWGKPVPHRPAEDLAYAVARFVARGGTFHNYYMFHGGTSFGRTAGGPLIITSYDYDVQLDEYGFEHEPKYSHTATLHRILDLYSKPILTNEFVQTSLGFDVEAHQYGSSNCTGEHCCVLFLSNYESLFDWSGKYNGYQFTVPRWTVSIVDCVTNIVVFNTGSISDDIAKSPANAVRGNAVFAPTSLSWYPETCANLSNYVVSQYPLELISQTRDQTDYMVYSTNITLSVNSASTGHATLSLLAQDYVLVLLDGVLLFKGQGNDFFAQNIILNVTGYAAGLHQLTIICKSEGLQNIGFKMETYVRGVGLGKNGTGSVVFDSVDVSQQTWLNRAFLDGEIAQYFNLEVASNLQWAIPSLETLTRPLTWWKFTFENPKADLLTAWALDLSTMGKGMAFVNGEAVGRYWNIIAQGSCNACDFHGTYNQNKCLTGCDDYTQRYYHVPVEWLGQGPITVILFEEIGASDPGNVSLVQMR